MEEELEQKLAAARVAFNAGQMSEARELYVSVMESLPDSTIAHYAVGTIDFQDKNYQSALEHFDRAAGLEPEAVDIAVNYAACLASVGNRLGALVQLQRATKYCRDDPIFCSKIAEMSERLGEPAAAVTMLSRLSVLLPKDQIVLANAQVSLGNWREAVNNLTRLHKDVKNDPVIAEKLSVAAGKLRDYPTAISAYEQYMRMVNPDANDYLRFADLLLLAQDSNRCDQTLKIAQSMGEDSIELYILKARVARLKGDFDAVLLALNEALDRQSNHGQVWSIKAEIAADDQLEGFISDLQKELENEDRVNQLNPHLRSLLYYALADMQDRLADYEGANNALIRANQIQYSRLSHVNGHYNKEATEEYFTKISEDFHRENFELPAAIISESDLKIAPIFIVGMPRSGTTLVERIICQNQKVFCGGELEAMEFVSAHYNHELRNERLPSPDMTEAKGWSQLRAMYLEKLPEIRKPIFTDKLPHNFRNVGLILKLFPEAKIIQMHRDAKDVSLSIYQHPFAPGHNYANRWEDLLHFNSQAERLMTHWSSLHSSQIMDLQYENLVREPQFYAQQLVEFLGFEWDNSYLEFHQSVAQSFTFSELQTRKPISEKRIGRWRSYKAYVPELQHDSA